MSEVNDFLDEITVKKDGKEIVITEKRVKEMVTILVENMNREAEFKDDFILNSKLVGQLIEVKKAFWPATQKSLQGNIDFNESLDKWFLLQNKLMEKSKEKAIVYDVINNEPNKLDN